MTPAPRPRRRDTRETDTASSAASLLIRADQSQRDLERLMIDRMARYLDKVIMAIPEHEREARVKAALAVPIKRRAERQRSKKR